MILKVYFVVYLDVIEKTIRGVRIDYPAVIFFQYFFKDTWTGVRVWTRPIAYIGIGL